MVSRIFRQQITSEAGLINIRYREEAGADFGQVACTNECPSGRFRAHKSCGARRTAPFVLFASFTTKTVAFAIVLSAFLLLPASSTAMPQSGILDDLGEILDEQNADETNTDETNNGEQNSGEQNLDQLQTGESGQHTGGLPRDGQEQTGDSDRAQSPGLPVGRGDESARTDPSLAEGPRGYLRIPSPRPDGWIVDLTGRVTGDEITKINALCDEVYEVSNLEMACVVIPSTGGQDLRGYATNLFNDWAVGNQFRNNGMLIFVALDEGGAEVILGDGVDNDSNVLSAQKLMDTIMVPRFRNGEVGSAIYAGARACATQVYSIANLESPKDIASDDVRWATGRRNINWFKDFGPVPYIFGGLLLGGVALVGGRHWLRYRSRGCSNCHDTRVLLKEDEDDQFLDPPEVIEERIGSVDYDVWACLTCEDVLKLRYGRFFTRYSDCPKCDYKTRLRIERTLVAATTVSGGVVRVLEECENCSYHQDYTYATPKLPKPSRSSSSGSSFGGGGGRSSGFGGGSSSGRGASGRW
ncbi:MAG: TPM domain-containing protein [Planctomycetota bacterium]